MKSNKYRLAVSLVLLMATCGGLWLSVRSSRYFVTARGDTSSAPGSVTYAADTFERSVTSAWGGADSGGAYELSGGGSSDYNVSGGAGTILEPAGGSSRLASLPDASARDVDITLRMRTNAMAAGGSQYVYVLARRARGATEYRGQVRFSTSGSVGLQAIQTVSSIETPLGSEVTVPGLAYTPNNYIWVRMLVVGAYPTTIQMSAWADGQTEPASWQYSVTNSDVDLQEAGMVGLRVYVSSSSTISPVLFGFDDLQVRSAGPPLNLVWKPYLQQLSDTGVIILWSTLSGANPVVRYSTDTSYSASAVGSTRVLSALGAELHRVALTGLLPNTTYCYKIYSDDTDLLPSELLSFQTAPSAGSSTPFTFIAFGDYGQDSVTQRRLRDQMVRDSFRFIITTGDNAYDKGRYQEFNTNVFPVYRDLFDRVGFFPSIGNHDYETDNGAPYLDLFELPATALRASDEERYYSFDYGNTHFVMLDSNAPLDATDSAAADDMFDWLRNDLNWTQQLWKVVVFHHPAYSVNGSTIAAQTKLVPIFETYGVDLVLNGHMHGYERSLPLRGGQVTTPEQGGIVYIVSGGGDAVTTPCGSADWLAFQSCATNKGLYNRINISGNQLTLEAVDDAGAVKDSVTWIKGGPAVNLSPTALSFASQPVGTTSPAQSVALGNTGSAVLTISNIAITGTNAGDFAQTNNCGSSVAAGGNCTINVTFAPTAAGSRAGTLTITDNASGSPQAAGLTGTGSSPGTNLPTVTSFTPASGPVGTVVTIIGSNFTGAKAVAFNGTAASTYTVDSDTQITATVPTGATTGAISVTTPAGTGISGSAFTVTVQPMNLLLNPGFELDSNGNNRPDHWTSNSRFTRTSAQTHSGFYAGKHFATDNSSYTIAQTINNLSAGTTYSFEGWANIPPTSDSFNFKLQVIWRNSKNKPIGTSTIKSYTTSTGGWEQVTANLVAPAGTANAQAWMVVTSLKATIYVDDFIFRMK